MLWAMVVAGTGFLRKRGGEPSSPIGTYQEHIITVPKTFVIRAKGIAVPKHAYHSVATRSTEETTMKTRKIPALRTMLAAGAAVLALGAAAPAFADGRDWRGHEAREHEWREHERWEHRHYAYAAPSYRYNYGYNYGYVAPAPVYPVAPSLNFVVPFSFR
jgi:hypothetical protein